MLAATLAVPVPIRVATSDKFFGFAPAAVTVGVGFGLAHNLSPAYFIISGLSSCIFSVMFANSGNNIVIPVVAHALYDLIALKLTLDDIAKKDAQAAAAK